MVSRDRSSSTGSAAGVPVFLAGFLCGVLGLLVVERASAIALRSDERLLTRVHELVSETYVDALPERELVDRALSGLVDGLDDYSRFLTGEEIALLDRETTGLYRGIGVLFRWPATPEEGARQILFALPGSPADEAGLRPGDRFLTVDGRVVAEMGPGELQRYLREHGDEPVAVELVTLEGEHRSVELRPQPVMDPSVRHGRVLDAEHGVGYLSVASFSRKTPQEFRAEVDHLADEGARSFVVDLRGNPGGVLQAAVEIADLFVGEGAIVSTRSRSDHRTFEAEPSAPYATLPLVLLVDGGTASAAEVLAGALQDHRAAVLVGTPSYGKGVVQTLTRFPDDRAIVKLTTSRYLTPAGRRIDRSSEDPHEHGIAPDLFVPLSPEAAAEVHGYLMGYSPPHGVEDELAAWAEREGTSLLDPPPPDAQLEAALGLLSGELLSAR